MKKEVAFLFGWLFCNGCLYGYNPWLASGAVVVVILWWVVLE